MASQFRLKLAAFVVAATLVVTAFYAWRADRRDRAQLAAELASAKQLLTAADARQRDRDTQLAQTLATLTAEKRNVVTPAQIVRELQKDIPLPAPITLRASRASPSSTQAVVGATPGPPAPTAADLLKNAAVIPAADLKPLYDFTLDCQACQAKLSAAQGDLADERQKTAALTKERDDALRIAKGGSAWRRIGRAARWFLLGVAAGAVISRAR